LHKYAPARYLTLKLRQILKREEPGNEVGRDIVI
jgi:hypothetical protein